MSAIFTQEIEELQNQLASILTNAEYIGDQMTLPQDVRNALREIVSAVGKATKVLEKAR